MWPTLRHVHSSDHPVCADPSIRLWAGSTIQTNPWDCMCMLLLLATRCMYVSLSRLGTAICARSGLIYIVYLSPRSTGYGVCSTRPGLGRDGRWLSPVSWEAKDTQAQLGEAKTQIRRVLLMSAICTRWVVCTHGMVRAARTIRQAAFVCSR